MFYILLSIFGILFLLYIAGNIFTIFFCEQLLHETLHEIKYKMFDLKKQKKESFIYLSPIFEEGKLKFVESQKKRYFFEILERRRNKFYSKGYRYLTFNDARQEREFLSIYKSFNKDNPHTDDDMILHVQLSTTWKQENAFIYRLIHFHSHNKTD